MHVERAFVSHSRRTCNNSTETFFFFERKIFSPFPLQNAFFSSVRKTKKEREKEEDEEVKEEEEEKLVL